MTKTILQQLSLCPNDSSIYLINKISEISGFFGHKKHLVYMVYNSEGVEHQSLTTEYLRLNTNVEITAVKNDQQFKTGRYNVIEILPSENGYDETTVESFINLCVAHTRFMGNSSFINFFYSLVNLFQYPREQKFINLIGFFGELSFLNCISGTIGNDWSDKWHASGSNDKYDIALDSCNFEIKTTMSIDEMITVKHSQLFNMDKNYLVVVVLEENNSGITLNSLISQMHAHPNHFKSYNFALNVEKEKKRVSPVDAAGKKFVMKSVNIYLADQINPFKEIPDNVTNLTYKIDLLDLPTIDISNFKSEK